jgi:hypothetical protein
VKDLSGNSISSSLELIGTNSIIKIEKQQDPTAYMEFIASSNTYFVSDTCNVDVDTLSHTTNNFSNGDVLIVSAKLPNTGYPPGNYLEGYDFTKIYYAGDIVRFSGENIKYYLALRMDNSKTHNTLQDPSHWIELNSYTPP